MPKFLRLINLDMTALLFTYVRLALLMVTSTFIGVFIATFLIEIKLARKIGRPLTPLMTASKLPKELSIPAMIGILNSKAEHSIVSSLKKNNSLSDTTIVIYNLVTMPLSFAFFFLKFYLPVVIVSLGLYVGLLYTAISLFSSLIGMIIGVTYGRLKLEITSITITRRADFTVKKKIAAKNSLKTATRMTTYIMKRYLLILAFIATLTLTGFFDWLKSAVQSYISTMGFSPEFALILSVQSISPTMGILTAGEMLRQCLIGVKETLLALILGKLIFLIVFDYPRHSFPFYVSMYPTKLAAKLTMTTLLVNTIATPILVGFVLLFA
jgi:hypothetical protein